jgi:hypothetical protein
VEGGRALGRRAGRQEGKIIEKWMRVPFGIRKSLGLGRVLSGLVRSWTQCLGLLVRERWKVRKREGAKRGGVLGASA